MYVQDDVLNKISLKNIYRVCMSRDNGESLYRVLKYFSLNFVI